MKFADLIEGRGIEQKAAFKKFWSSYTRGRTAHKPRIPLLGWVTHQAQQLHVQPDADGQVSSPELTQKYVQQYEAMNHLVKTTKE